MPEAPAIRIKSKYNVSWVGDISPVSRQLASLATPYQLQITDSTFANLRGDLNRKPAQIVYFQLSPDNYSQFVALRNEIWRGDVGPIPIVVNQGLTIEQITELVNHFKIVNIIGGADEVESALQSAIEQFCHHRDEHNALRKVKNQNVQLELLTQNLENLVLERTRKDFDSSHLALNSLKRIQDLLRFIKQIARTETIEEILSAVRREFKRYHGLRPPMLLFAESAALLRFFYFQGKQFVERKVVVENLAISNNNQDNQALRLQLSNLFGRPFGQLEWYDFRFSGKESEANSAVLVCEHSFSAQERELFREETVEKWPIVRLAIENVLLREDAQVTARQWARTFNEMQDPIFIIYKDYHMTLANARVPQVRTNICYQDFANRDSPCVDCPVTKTIATNEAQSADIHCRGKVYRVHAFPILLPGQEEVTFLINQYVDMTSSRDLQGRVIQGEKMAAIGMLAGNVAHELNNPLTGIHSLAALLLEELDAQSNTYKDLVEIKDAARRCQDIIKDLLEFSDAGADQAHQIIDANEMVRKTLPLLKMATRNHNTNVSLLARPLYVEINPQLFQQVIFNLVNNACQAMPGEGNLYITSQQVDQLAVIAVADTGPGIPDEIKEVIFDPFFTTKQKGKGTGLGLSMSRSIVEHYGGQLRLERSDAEGSEFVILLPLKEAH